MRGREHLVQMIEDQGYRVRGWHDTVNANESCPTTIIAEHPQTGETHMATVHTPGATGELEALLQLAQSIGLDASP